MYCFTWCLILKSQRWTCNVVYFRNLCFTCVITSKKQPKNIGWAKDKDTVAHSTAIRWFKKFRSGCKNVDDQLRLGWLKSVDSDPVLQDLGKIPVSSTQWIPGELGILQFSVVCNLLDPGKSICNYRNCAWRLQNIVKLLTHPSTSYLVSISMF